MRPAMLTDVSPDIPAWQGGPAGLPPSMATSAREFARHDLVWLDPVSGPSLLRTGREQDQEIARAWLRAGRPFVVRRDDGAGVVAASQLSLGLPLPSRLDRRRIALHVPRAAVWRSGNMPLLSDAREVAFSGWRQPLRALCERMAESGATVRAYGSLGWQYLTGEAYLHPDSDIDLLIEPGSRRDIVHLLAVLADLRHGDRPRFDGEISLAPDQRVAWRELFVTTPDVLVRGRDGAGLMPRAALRRLLQLDVAAC